MSHPSSLEIPRIYTEHADEWDTIRQRYFADQMWLDRFLHELPAKGQVLDIGCGSGKPIADYCIKKGFSVTGVDISAPLIALCRQRLPDAEWIESDMRTLSLNKTFDGVIAWDSFFHLTQEDQRHMFDVFQSHIRPDGYLMFNSGPSSGEAIGQFMGETLYHASLAPEEYRTLLASHGFEVIDFVKEDPNCGGRTVWLCHKNS